MCKIANIRGSTTVNANVIAVLVDSANQLGTVSSTRSKKENIIPVDVESNKTIIESLLPRRFDYIGCHGDYQSYGMIFDEIENIVPDLCCYNDDGTPLTIYYQHLPIMLLTEIQRMNLELNDLKNRLIILENK